MHCITFDINLLGRQVGQYKNFTFNSMAKFGSDVLLANANGLYRLSGHKDGTNNILSEFKVTANFSSTPMYIYAMYIEAQATAELLLTINVDNKPARTYPLALGPDKLAARTRIGRGLYGFNWSFVVSNPSGAAFTINSIKALPRLRHAKNI